MAPRLDLQKKLISILGSKNVYFQPPENLKIQYPCIVYSLETYDVTNADNQDYRIINRYQVTVIDRNPESTIPLEIQKMQFSSHDQRFTKDGLYHDIFTIYF